MTTIVRNPAALAGRILGLVDLGNLSGITSLVQTPLAVRTAIESFTRAGGGLSWQSFLPLTRFGRTVTALLDDDDYHYAGGGTWEPGEAPQTTGGSYYGGAGGSSTLIPVARRQEQINRAELTVVRRAATIEMARTAVREDFATAGEATAAADAIATAVDRELATAGDEDGQALQALSIATQQALAARVPELPRALVFRVAAPAVERSQPPALDALGRRFGYVPGATLPAIVIAQAVYGDAVTEVAARAEEIVTRNRIAHPGFVPGGEPLELLSVG